MLQGPDEMWESEDLEVLCSSSFSLKGCGEIERNDPFHDQALVKAADSGPR
jgi:hypothetical protein